MDFLAAYNAHEARKALSFLVPGVRYSDCDYVQNTEVLLAGKTAVKQWLVTVFAGDDRLDDATVEVGPDPRDASVVAERTNHALVIQGRSPLLTNGIKIVLNPSGTLIDVYSAGGTPCLVRRFPRRATVVHSHVLVQQFLDTYNARDVPGVLGTLARNVTYGDCNYDQHQLFLLRGKAQVKTWLIARFKEHDHFVDADTNVGPDDPRAGGITGTRESDPLRPLEARGLVPTSMGLKLVINREGDRIEHTAQTRH
jgi:hypothetical protein